MRNAIVRKIAGDLWNDHMRCLLVLLAIVAGTLGAGTVMDSRAILSREMKVNYMGTNPSSALLSTTGLSADDIAFVKNFPGVAEAEAFDEYSARVKLGGEQWKSLRLFVLPDYKGSSVDRISSDSGEWPPTLGTILIERAALAILGGGVDSSVIVSLGKGDENHLQVTGIVHAPGMAPAWMERMVYGWISSDTARSIGAIPIKKYLRVRLADNTADKARIGDTVFPVKSALEERGVTVTHVEIPKPGEHPHQTQMMTLLYLLEIFGLLALFLSGILVASTISSLMARQLKQIGIMKAIGGKTTQIAGMYYALVIILGVLSACVSLPAAAWLTRIYSKYSARLLNFTIFSASIPLSTYAIQLAIGIFVPLLVATPSILKGSRITVRAALDDSGFSDTRSAYGKFDKLLSSAAGSSRPLLLSLRNAFRRRVRFLLTVATLAAGGAVFITSMNVSSSITNTVERRYGSMRFDFMASLTTAVPSAKLSEAVKNIPGIARHETWGRLECSRIYDDGSEGNSFFLVAFPSDGTLQGEPVISSGRWLESNDTDSIVFNQRVMSANPDLKLGDRIRIKTLSGTSEWTVIGVTTEIMAGFVAYTTKERFDTVNDLEGMAKSLIVSCEDQSPESIDRVISAVEQNLKANGIGVSSLTSLASARQMAIEHFMILSLMLALMALLVVTVGILGLSSAMSINVLERTREIGIMRSIGATTNTIGGMIVVEALVAGLASWIGACALSWPVSNIITSRFGMIFFEAPLQFELSPQGMLIWLSLTLGSSLLASLVPALNAATIPISKAIAWE